MLNSISEAEEAAKDSLHRGVRENKNKEAVVIVILTTSASILRVAFLQPSQMAKVGVLLLVARLRSPSRGAPPILKRR